MTKNFVLSLFFISIQIFAGTEAFQVHTNIASSKFIGYHSNPSTHFSVVNRNSSLHMVSSLNSDNKRRGFRIRRFLSVTNVLKRRRNTDNKRETMDKLFYQNGNEVDGVAMDLPVTPSASSEVQDTLNENIIVESLSITQELPKEKPNVQLPHAFDLPAQSGKVREQMMASDADMIETFLGRIAMVASVFLFYQEIFNGISFPDQLGL